MWNYVRRVGSAISQLLNVLILFGKDENESISGRAYREPWYFAERLINAVIFWDEQHCREAYMNDLRRAAQTLKRHSTVKQGRA